MVGDDLRQVGEVVAGTLGDPRRRRAMLGEPRRPRQERVGDIPEQRVPEAVLRPPRPSPTELNAGQLAAREILEGRICFVSIAFRRG